MWNKDSCIGNKSLGILYRGVFIADKVGRNFGKLSTTGL